MREDKIYNKDRCLLKKNYIEHLINILFHIIEKHIQHCAILGPKSETIHNLDKLCKLLEIDLRYNIIQNSYIHTLCDRPDQFPIILYNLDVNCESTLRYINTGREFFDYIHNEHNRHSKDRIIWVYNLDIKNDIPTQIEMGELQKYERLVNTRCKELLENLQIKQKGLLIMLYVSDCYKIVYDILSRYYSNNKKTIKFCKWEDANKNVKDNIMTCVLYQLNYPQTTPELLHNAWCRKRILDGWTYDKMYSAKHQTTPSLVTYEDLDDTDKIVNDIIVDVTNSLRKYVDSDDIKDATENYKDFDLICNNEKD